MISCLDRLAFQLILLLHMLVLLSVFILVVRVSPDVHNMCVVAYVLSIYICMALALTPSLAYLDFNVYNDTICYGITGQVTKRVTMTFVCHKIASAHVERGAVTSQSNRELQVQILLLLDFNETSVCACK